MADYEHERYMHDVDRATVTIPWPDESNLTSLLA